MDRKQTVINILEATYGKSEFLVDLHNWVAGGVMNIINDRSVSDVHHEVMTLLWVNFSGGDTASNATDEILAAVGLVAV